MKVWITKYAITKGIMEVDVSDCGNGMVATLGKWTTYYHGEGKDWHKTKASAINRAETMRAKKLASLEKQIKKIRAMKF